jgi:tRNA (cmo5U34)-methyltransferase
MQRCDHHDWTSETYVDEWVRRQRAEDSRRAERFQLICDLLPFPTDARVTIIDVGAGYGALSAFILECYPHATCIAQDGSEPMLQRARNLMAGFGPRFQVHESDLFEANWLPTLSSPFAAAVSSSCLHNLRDFRRISEIYHDIREHLQPGGVFLNFDLLNAPTPELQQRYSTAAEIRRQRERPAAEAVGEMVRRADQPTTGGGVGPFPAALEQHLTALKAAGFTQVDCFWKDLQRALYGGYV